MVIFGYMQNFRALGQFCRVALDFLILRGLYTFTLEQQTSPWSVRKQMKLNLTVCCEEADALVVDNKIEETENHFF